MVKDGVELLERAFVFLTEVGEVLVNQPFLIYLVVRSDHIATKVIQMAKSVIVAFLFEV